MVRQFYFALDTLSTSGLFYGEELQWNMFDMFEISVSMLLSFCTLSVKKKILSKETISMYRYSPTKWKLRLLPLFCAKMECWARTFFFRDLRVCSSCFSWWLLSKWSQTDLFRVMQKLCNCNSSTIFKVTILFLWWSWRYFKN